jgi:peptide chain release factor
MRERLNRHAWKACVPKRYRGFESLSLRKKMGPFFGALFFCVRGEGEKPSGFYAAVEQRLWFVQTLRLQRRIPGATADEVTGCVGGRLRRGESLSLRKRKRGPVVGPLLFLSFLRYSPRMPVSSAKSKDLAARMAAVGIHERDLAEHFVRSSGAGGQNVNKVSTCVVLKHGPSGIEVKCQAERSQVLNRYLARRILCEKLERKILGAKSAAEMRRWKIRKQKKRRSKKAKEKMLADKRHQSTKKQLRKIRDE